MIHLKLRVIQARTFVEPIPEEVSLEAKFKKADAPIGQNVTSKLEQLELEMKNLENEAMLEEEFQQLVKNKLDIYDMMNTSGYETLHIATPFVATGVVIAYGAWLMQAAHKENERLQQDTSAKET